MQQQTTYRMNIDNDNDHDDGGINNIQWISENDMDFKTFAQTINAW